MVCENPLTGTLWQQASMLMWEQQQEVHVNAMHFLTTGERRQSLNREVQTAQIFCSVMETEADTMRVALQQMERIRNRNVQTEQKMMFLQAQNKTSWVNWTSFLRQRKGRIQSLRDKVEGNFMHHAVISPRKYVDMDRILLEALVEWMLPDSNRGLSSCAPLVMWHLMRGQLDAAFRVLAINPLRVNKSLRRQWESLERQANKLYQLFRSRVTRRIDELTPSREKHKGTYVLEEMFATQSAVEETKLDFLVDMRKEFYPLMGRTQKIDQSYLEAIDDGSVLFKAHEWSQVPVHFLSDTITSVDQSVKRVSVDMSIADPSVPIHASNMAAGRSPTEQCQDFRNLLTALSFDAHLCYMGSVYGKDMVPVKNVLLCNPEQSTIIIDVPLKRVETAANVDCTQARLVNMEVFEVNVCLFSSSEAMMDFSRRKRYQMDPKTCEPKALNRVEKSLSKSCHIITQGRSTTKQYTQHVQFDGHWLNGNRIVALAMYIDTLFEMAAKYKRNANFGEHFWFWVVTLSLQMLMQEVETQITQIVFAIESSFFAKDTSEESKHFEYKGMELLMPKNISFTPLTREARDSIMEKGFFAMVTHTGPASKPVDPQSSNTLLMPETYAEDLCDPKATDLSPLGKSGVFNVRQKTSLSSVILIAQIATSLSFAYVMYMIYRKLPTSTGRVVMQLLMRHFLESRLLGHGAMEYYYFLAITIQLADSKIQGGGPNREGVERRHAFAEKAKDIQSQNEGQQAESSERQTLEKGKFWNLFVTRDRIFKYNVILNLILYATGIGILFTVGLHVNFLIGLLDVDFVWFQIILYWASEFVAVDDQDIISNKMALNNMLLWIFNLSILFKTILNLMKLGFNESIMEKSGLKFEHETVRKFSLFVHSSDFGDALTALVTVAIIFFSTMPGTNGISLLTFLHHRVGWLLFSQMMFYLGARRFAILIAFGLFVVPTLVEITTVHILLLMVALPALYVIVSFFFYWTKKKVLEYVGTDVPDSRIFQPTVEQCSRFSFLKNAAEQIPSKVEEGDQWLTRRVGRPLLGFAKWVILLSHRTFVVVSHSSYSIRDYFPYFLHEMFRSEENSPLDKVLENRRRGSIMNQSPYPLEMARFLGISPFDTTCFRPEKVKTNVPLNESWAFLTMQNNLGQDERTLDQFATPMNLYFVVLERLQHRLCQDKRSDEAIEWEWKTDTIVQKLKEQKTADWKNRLERYGLHTQIKDLFTGEDPVKEMEEFLDMLQGEEKQQVDKSAEERREEEEFREQMYQEIVNVLVKEKLPPTKVAEQNDIRRRIPSRREEAFDYEGLTEEEQDAIRGFWESSQEKKTD